MEVEDHVLTFHFGEDGVESCVVHDAVVAVGGDAVGVGFDACDACLLRLLDRLGRDVGVEVEGHEECYIGFQCL